MNITAINKTAPIASKWFICGGQLPSLTSGFGRRFVIVPLNVKTKNKRPALSNEGGK